MRMNETILNFKKSMKEKNINELKAEKKKLKEAIKNHLGMMETLTRLKINALTKEIERRG